MKKRLKIRSTCSAMQTVSLAIAVFTAMAGIVFPVAANADEITYTTADGVKWIYETNNHGENTVTFSKLDSGDVPQVPTSEIPWVFTKDGVSYTVTGISSDACYENTALTGPLALPDSVISLSENTIKGAFHGCSGVTGTPKFGSGITVIPHHFLRYTSITGGLVVPENITGVMQRAFNGTKITSALIKGPPTAKSGDQVYTTIQLPYTFSVASLEFLVLGPNTKVDNRRTYDHFLATQAQTVLYPDYPDNKTWAENVINFPSKVKAIPYGPGLDLDIAIDGNVLTATPTTEAMLANVLTWAPRFKNDFDMDTKVCITNPIPVAEGLVTADLLKKAEFGSLMFKVTSQKQLDDVLAATASVSVPIGIDPDVADKHEMLSLPADRKVWVLLSGNGKYIPKVNGLVITFQ